MSLQDTYQSCKNLLASNLTSMGVTASGTEGLTALINKVLDISPATIALATNKNILSYYDSETATLTATHSGGAGKSVSVYNAVTGSKIGDMTDAGGGTYTYTYNSTGVGDISMTATSGTIESNSISIEDCLYFDSQTTDKNRYTVESGGATITYSSNGVTITGTQQTNCIVKNTALTLPSEYIATLEITGVDGETDSSGNIYYGGLVFDDWFTDWKQNNKSSTYKYSTTTELSSNLSKLQINDVVKIVRENNSMKQYINDVLISTDNNINHTGYYRHRTYKKSYDTGRSLTVKNLKIKPL